MINEGASSKLSVNWILVNLFSRLNEEEISILESPVTFERLANLVLKIEDQTISNNAAKKVFEALWKNPEESVEGLIESMGLKQISDSSELEGLVDQVLDSNANMVNEFKSGKDKAFNALVGQVMKASKGKANPSQVNEILTKKLSN